MKTRGSKKAVHAFLTVITKKMEPKNIGSTWEQNLPESSRNYAKLKE